MGSDEGYVLPLAPGQPKRGYRSAYQALRHGAARAGGTALRGPGEPLRLSAALPWELLHPARGPWVIEWYHLPVQGSVVKVGIIDPKPGPTGGEFLGALVDLEVATPGSVVAWRHERGWPGPYLLRYV